MEESLISLVKDTEELAKEVAELEKTNEVKIKEGELFKTTTAKKAELTARKAELTKSSEKENSGKDYLLTKETLNSLTSKKNMTVKELSKITSMVSKLGVKKNG